MEVYDLFLYYLLTDNLNGVKKFLDVGRNPNETVIDEFTPLFIAKQFGLKKLYNLLLSYNADPSLLPKKIKKYYRKK